MVVMKLNRSLREEGSRWQKIPVISRCYIALGCKTPLAIS